MKHKGLILFFVLNEVSAVALAATKSDGRAMIQSMLGAVALTFFLGIMWLFVRIGMFRGLKFRHYAFIMLCVMLAMAGGYYFGQVGTR